jgi:hypothetical protein
VGQLEGAGEQVGAGAVGQDRDDECRAQDGRPADGLPPAASRREKVDHGGQQQRLTDLGDRRRGSEHHPDEGNATPARARPPEQDGEPGHDHRLEPDVRHERLLDLYLVCVEQDWRDG